MIKALIIDDSKVMRMMVIRALNHVPDVQWEFIEANDGMEALNYFVSMPIDMGFVDWNMPNMTGIDFVRHVRELGGTEHIPLIMVTSEKTVARIEEALNEAGANAYICKPFTEEEINQRIGPIIQAVMQIKGRSGSFLSRLLN